MSLIGDAPILPDLLDQIPQDQEICSVTADGAFDARKCHDAIADRGACAFGHSFGAMAVIPSPPAPQECKALEDKHLWSPDVQRGLAGVKPSWPRPMATLSGYHRRRRVETKMHRVKLLGQRLMAGAFNREVGELQVRLAVLNGYTALGIPVTEAVG
jgi:hypothetical protein